MATKFTVNERLSSARKVDADYYKQGGEFFYFYKSGDETPVFMIAARLVNNVALTAGE